MGVCVCARACVCVCAHISLQAHNLFYTFKGWQAPVTKTEAGLGILRRKGLNKSVWFGADLEGWEKLEGEETVRAQAADLLPRGTEPVCPCLFVPMGPVVVIGIGWLLQSPTTVVTGSGLELEPLPPQPEAESPLPPSCCLILCWPPVLVEPKQNPASKGFWEM